MGESSLGGYGEYGGGSRLCGGYGGEQALGSAGLLVVSPVAWWFPTAVEDAAGCK